VELVGDALRRTAGIQTEIRGTGDLCLGDRKVLGSSAFSGRGAFFYQASLLVEANLDLMERYLRHPSREPTYRRGRGHREFLTTLTGAGYRGTAAALALRLRRDLADFPGRVDPGSVVTTEALKYKT
jgi:lipoate-protein ligase A